MDRKPHHLCRRNAKLYTKLLLNIRPIIAIAYKYISCLTAIAKVLPLVENMIKIAEDSNDYQENQLKQVITFDMSKVLLYSSTVPVKLVFTSESQLRKTYGAQNN